MNLNSDEIYVIIENNETQNIGDVYLTMDDAVPEEQRLNNNWRKMYKNPEDYLLQKRYNVMTLEAALMKIIRNARDEADAEGQQTGYEDGSSSGYESGYSDGKEEMKNDMLSEIDDAYDRGKTDGYNEGYEDGREAGEVLSDQ